MSINDFYIKERYKRNLAIEKISEQAQQKLFCKKILIAGAGGLGSGVIAGMASLGVGHIDIIDCDVIELSNLNRQFIHSEQSVGMPKVESAYKWIKNYNSSIKVDIFYTKFDENSDINFIKNYDLVLDCFDSFNSKFTLNKICIEAKVPLIHGGVEDFSGQALTIIPGQSSCLNCFINLPDLSENRVIGVISPTVNVISSLQAMEASKYLLGVKPVQTNSLLAYDGLRQELRKIKLNRNINCPACGIF